MRRLEPGLRLPDQVPAVFYPDEAWVHGRHLVGRLVDQAVASGAERRSGTAVRDIGTGAGGRVRTVVLSDGSRLDVDIVVNAAGPSAAHVAGLVARNLPMCREPGVVARLLHESARHVVPDLGDARIARTRVAHRPIPADGFPSVGAVPSVPGYYDHSGITLGPVIGRLLAAEIRTGTSDEMLADFRPERFQ